MSNTQLHVALVEDNELVRDTLAAILRAANFTVSVFGEAEAFLARLAARRSDECPDLAIIDLQLNAGKMQGMELIRRLAERDAPFEYVVLSGAATGEEMAEALRLGASCTLLKPILNVNEFRHRMTHLAKIGRGRRQYSDPSSIDERRARRQVFLSYSSKDRLVATGIRRNIEALGISVWYAPSTLAAGDAWRLRILAGLDDARVFIPFVTFNYVSSVECIEELTRFYFRLRDNPDDGLLILPTGERIADAASRNPIIDPMLSQYQYVELSGGFVDGLTALFATLEREFGSPLQMPHPPNGGATVSIGS